ncbi:hypothetical protein SAMN05660484_02311 [Eubacterium ruminantium]|uniref:Uncharacterized protein n=1 Tax=Eubacterium ruminantium TaxID=42322 RepID=A0A1T4PZN3_9FIRM|nr:DUF6062 family protein [Eubacterium ruminantium]SCW65302.1 hypothetical protein SAMN05660484_02311 [Eubacterium ruminantium]SDN24447.1 hypothetical protein SAMN04490370_11442 [Eubacterium ruminantium]SJZ96974.1 hypothetical protein SAMN02745110_02205 [Eubacterium ruminantium]
MAEKIYTIPVNDAFNSGCECPLCKLYTDLERESIDFTMGPSYMEDDNRAVTDKMWFCPTHVRMLYAEKNRLGLALMMNTHTNKVIKDLREAVSKGHGTKSGLFSKAGKSAVGTYIDNLEESCFICDRINKIFPRYIDTIFHMWKNDKDFIPKFKESKGFCTYHFGILYDEAPNKLKGKQLDEFTDALVKVYFDNIERVNGDVSWFIDKYDYRNNDAPWKNSKDALPRGIIKSSHTIIE